MDLLSKFEQIASNKSISTELTKEDLRIQNKESLSNKRLGRITGSKYDQISFQETRSFKGKTISTFKKDDYKGYISSCKEGKQALSDFLSNSDKESIDDLLVAELKQISEFVPAEFAISKSSISYIMILLGECIREDFAPMVRSKSLDHGIKYEPEAIEFYKQKYFNDPKYSFVTNEFIINPENDLYGSTPDLIIYNSEFSSTIPFVVSEFKCPEQPKNHAANIVRAKDSKILKNIDRVDPRYTKQVLGHGLNTKALHIDFVSYDPFAIKEDKKLSLVRIKKEEIQEEMNQLKRDLDHFCKIYLEYCDLLDIDLKKILK